jgi:hypothetical protein
MNSLIIFKDNGNIFEKDQILNILKSIKGISKIKENINPNIGSLSAIYDNEKDSTIIELSNDYKDLNISQLGEASLELALILKDKLKDNLRVTDYSYSFDFI